MTKVYALYHADRTMPLGVYATEKLAFEAMEFCAGALGGRQEYTVVSFNVFNKV